MFATLRRRTVEVAESNARPAVLVRRAAGVPSARTIAAGLGAARTGVGVVFLAAPVPALRILGVDSATAARVNWLSRMTAARDGVLGAGTLDALRRGSGGGAWVLAGALADATDALALTAGLRSRRLGGIGALAMIASAAGAAVAGGIAAAGLARESRRR